MKIGLSIVLMMFIAGCQSRGPVVYFPEQPIGNIDWTDEEKRKPMAVRPFYKSQDASAAIIRISENERPHYHDKHDLNATVLTGQLAINYESQRVLLKPGDTMFIPKGTYHWVELINGEPVEAFVLFSPAFDGKDRRFADK